MDDSYFSLNTARERHNMAPSSYIQDQSNSRVPIPRPHLLNAFSQAAVDLSHPAVGMDATTQNRGISAVDLFRSASPGLLANIMQSGVTNPNELLQLLAQGQLQAPHFRELDVSRSQSNRAAFLSGTENIENRTLEEIFLQRQSEHIHPSQVPLNSVNLTNSRDAGSLPDRCNLYPSNPPNFASAGIPFDFRNFPRNSRSTASFIEHNLEENQSHGLPDSMPQRNPSSVVATQPSKQSNDLSFHSVITSREMTPSVPIEDEPQSISSVDEEDSASVTEPRSLNHCSDSGSTSISTSSVSCPFPLPTSTTFDPFNKRLHNLKNLPIPPKGASKSQILAIQRAKIGFSKASTPRTLELLRKLLQKYINKEIASVIEGYWEKYFQLALKNIRNNLGEEAVSGDYKDFISRQILKEALLMYGESDSDADVAGVKSSIKRSDSLPTEPANLDIDHTEKRLANTRIEIETEVSYNKGLVTLNIPMTLPDTVKSSNLDRKRRRHSESVGFHANRSPSCHAVGIKSSASIERKIDSKTLFVSGAKANKLLGFTSTKHRLYVKFPNLYKYLADNEDKQWLVANGLSTGAGNKYYLLFLSDIQTLADTGLLGSIATSKLDLLTGFTLPGWMVEKIRKHRDSRNRRRRGGMKRVARQQGESLDAAKQTASFGQSNTSNPPGKFIASNVEAPPLTAPYNGTGDSPFDL